MQIKTFHWFQYQGWLILDIWDAEVKSKKEKRFSLLPFFLRFCLKWSGMIPPSRCCPTAVQSCTGYWFLRPEFPRWVPTNMWLCLGWDCRPEGSVTLPQQSCVLALHFLSSFWETHTCICHATHVGYFLRQREALLRAFTKATSWIKEKIQTFILNAQKRKMGKAQCSWGILDIRRAAQSSESKTHQKNNQWLWLYKN